MCKNVQTVRGWLRGGALTLKRDGGSRVKVTVVRGINKQRLNVIVERHKLMEALGKV